MRGSAPEQPAAARAGLSAGDDKSKGPRVEELLRRRADDDPVTVGHRPAEQPVANRAADEIGLHGPAV